MNRLLALILPARSLRWGPLTTAWHSPFNFASLEWDDSAWDDGVDWPAVGRSLAARNRRACRERTAGRGLPRRLPAHPTRRRPVTPGASRTRVELHRSQRKAAA